MNTCKMVFTRDEELMPSDWAYRCSNCNKRISRRPLDDIRFCPYCGYTVESWIDERDIDDGK